MRSKNKKDKSLNSSLTLLAPFVILLIIGTAVLPADLFHEVALILEVKELFLETAIIFITAVVLFNRRQIQIKKTALTYSLFAFLVILGFSTVTSTDVIASIYSLFSWLLLILFFLVISTMWDGNRQLFLSLLFLTVLISIYGIMSYYNWYGLGQKTEVATVFRNGNVRGGFLAFIIPFLIALFPNSDRRLYRISVTIVVLLACYALLLSKTRGAWLGFLLSLPIAFLVLKSRHITISSLPVFRSLRRRLLFAFLLFTCFAILIGLDYRKTEWDSFTKRLLSIRYWERSSVVDRFICWHTALDMFRERPLIGTGIGTFEKYHCKFQGQYLKGTYSKIITVSRYVHNDYLQLLGETGIIGLSVFLTVLASFFFYGFKSLKFRKSHPRETISIVALMASVLTMVVHNFFHYSLQLPTMRVLLFLAFGLLNSRVKASEVPVRMRLSKRQFSFILIGLVIAFVLTAWRFSAVYYHDRGVFWEKASDLEKAKEMYLRAEKFPLHRASVALHLGNVFLAEANYHQAIEWFRKAILCNPYLAVAYNNLANTYTFDTPPNFQEAINSYQHAIAIEPHLSVAHYNLGMVYLRCGEYVKARRAFQEVLQIQPDLAPAHYHLGTTYAFEGKMAEAIKQWEETLQIDPTNKPALLSLERARQK